MISETECRGLIDDWLVWTFFNRVAKLGFQSDVRWAVGRASVIGFRTVSQIPFEI